MARIYRFLEAANTLATVKKTKSAPWGMNGGLDGAVGKVIVWPGTEKEHANGAIHTPMDGGDVIENYSGGGGGWGDPTQRDPQLVLKDVRDGYVSESSAREDYGVAIDTVNWIVDEEATAALRA